MHKEFYEKHDFVNVFAMGGWYCVSFDNKFIHYMWKKWNKLTKKEKLFFKSFKDMVKYAIAINH